MQADAEHVRAEPAPARHDVANDREAHEAALLHQPAPAGVEDERVPNHDDERAIFLRIPAPEAAPGLVGPNAAEYGAHEAEQRGEADDAVDHAGEGIGRGL